MEIDSLSKGKDGKYGKGKYGPWKGKGKGQGGEGGGTYPPPPSSYKGKDPKGKGKAKPFDGNCSRCGRYGHKQAQCWSKTDVNGKA